MDWIKDEVVLKDFEIFLKKVFGFIHKNIKLTAVRQSLLVFICSTPFFMVAAIVRIVQESEQLLLQLGVVSIVVEGDVVFKVRQNDTNITSFSDPVYLFAFKKNNSCH